MPTYDYECSACGHRFDELQSFSEPPLTKCPKCKKSKLVRLFGGGGAIIFKGGGFYETDYRRAGEANNTGDKAEGSDADKGETKTATDAKTETKTETKPEAKTETKPAVDGGGSSSGKAGGKGGGKKAK